MSDNNNKEYNDNYNDSFKDYIQYVDDLKKEINTLVNEISAFDVEISDFVKKMSGNVFTIKCIMDKLEDDINKIRDSTEIIEIDCFVASFKNNIFENLDIIRSTNYVPLFQGLIGKLIDTLSNNTHIIFDVTVQDYRLTFFKSLKKKIDIMTKEFTLEIELEIMDCSNDLEIAMQLNEQLNG